MAAADPLNAAASPPAPEAAGTGAPASLEDQLRQAGLEVLGSCQKMSGRGPGLLQHSALLEDFTMKELDTLGDAMLLIRAQPGQVLIAEGDAGDWMLLLLSGTVDVTKTTLANDDDPDTADNKSRLGVTTEGAVLGEMSMFDRDVRYATCTAIDAVEAAVLSRAAIGQLIRQHPGVGAKLMVKITQLLAQRLRNTSNRLVRLLQKR
ncbi:MULTISPECIES: cyclic nucleotide-binding domain-containing protein [unclassified Polaromonas]|jgi:CRP-like cAMP-binding protein|uniref:cyclic nucleotide-binding domain-containing protein n=1 Tax=unclassified Polaromonas TaxID=2638319 RepID=UPI000BCD9D73|nr:MULTISPECIES: cyclic nucleotide-binding domain-containing protein [unclassified Polaromonas]OYY38386.1 MAG: cyclic nucleotide-binding protein [Polaromonas sp. 35-63-35]OYZ17479.1 MAG: cyclic nucleotide-binding protein [Polaromonas sp. 16-63-31]OYZ76735.1 MAG: cyclic nucleotide-binding protein [Polaromonas sp. 24-63-21]OZA47892.1 MAG: cyclic nucleotide-binding protein [Polaromonas sp. 17-63-33]OZA86009.1 MAG: cyclic nucleotide-binding protein [Polaromonas sp. 39-63-25]